MRPDQAVRETGALLHDHMIGLVTLHSSPDPDGWLPFLGLLAKPLDEVRASGGVARLWAATGQRHLDLQEIDYADILRERTGGQLGWDDIIRASMNFDSPLDDETLRDLVKVCGDPEQFSDLVVALERNGEISLGSKASALLRMLRGVVELISKTDPGKLDPLLRSIAQGFGAISPELLLELLSSEEGRADKAADLVLQVASRMTDATVGGFVARAVISQGGATTRLAQAFQTLVPETERRPGLIEIARTEVAQSPLGANEGFRRPVEERRRHADVVQRRTVRVGELWPRAFGSAHAGRRGRAGVQRPAGSHRHMGVVGGRRRGSRARFEAAARPAQD